MRKTARMGVLAATVLSGSAGGVLVAESAVATTPEVLAQLVVQDDGPLVNCGAFTVNDDASAQIRVTLLRDQSGAPSRAQVKINGTDTLYNAAGGPRYTSPNVLTVNLDLRRDREVKAGVAFAVTVPGYGTVFMDVGVIRVDELGATFAGQHQAEEFDVAELCQAFA